MIGEAATEAGCLTCSLGRWMMQERDLLAGLEQSQAIDWLSIAADLSRYGLVDQQGRPPTAESAEAMWWSVRNLYSWR